MRSELPRGPRDLGTYHIRVELDNGDGFIMENPTGWRFSHGSGSCHPLDARAISPAWESEEDLIECTRYMWTDGNFSCDCNKRLFLAEAHQQPEPADDKRCGGTLTIKRLTLIRPDMTEVQILP